MARKRFGIILLLLGLGGWARAQDTSIFEKKNFVKDGDTLLYRMLYPKNFSEEASYPLIIFLHGAGERGNDNEKQLTQGSSLFTNDSNRTAFPAIVIFPQCQQEDYWANVLVDRNSHPIGLEFQYEKGPTKALRSVMALLDNLSGKNYVDQDRIYVMGLSMGGMGTYELLSRRPETFAAAVPICGGGDPNSTAKYAPNVPVWAFHGSRDDVVDPQQSIAMVSAILDAGGFPKFTLYDNANHNSWDSAFAEPDLLSWLFSHSLKN